MSHNHPSLSITALMAACLVPLLAVLSPALAADEQDQKQPAVQVAEPYNPEGEVDAETESHRDRARDRPATEDIFRPSETISEDLSVPFPVDI